MFITVTATLEPDIGSDHNSGGNDFPKNTIKKNKIRKNKIRWNITALNNNYETKKRCINQLEGSTVSIQEDMSVEDR